MTTRKGLIAGTVVVAALSLAACGGSTNTDGGTASPGGTGDATPTTKADKGATTTTTAAAGDELGTMVIDGETFPAGPAPSFVLKSWAVQEPRKPCVLDPEAISVVVQDPTKHFTFVAEGASADALEVFVGDSQRSQSWKGEALPATVSDGTFAFSGTLDGRAGPMDVKVSLTC